VKLATRNPLQLRGCLLAGALLVLLGGCYYYEDEDGGVPNTPLILASITVSPDGGTLAAGMAQQFTVTGAYDNGFRADITYATWRSSDTRIATVSATGLVRAVASGSAFITATVDGIADSAAFTVSSVALVSIDISPLSTIVKQGHRRQFAARGNYANQSTADITLSVTWSSSDSVAAKISNAEGSQGLASGLAWSDTPVTVSAAFGGVSGSTSLRVTTPGWHGAGTLQSRREGHTATLLRDGKVLIAGGRGDLGMPVLPSEVFDASTGLSTYTANGLHLGRYGHTATLLHDGRVLLVGSGDGSPQDAPVIYDPASGQWTLTSKPGTDRTGHTATLLANGKVLIVGGSSASARCISSAELYDPANGQWMATGNLARGRCLPSATLLGDGSVLVFGGTDDQSIAHNTAEIYKPATGLWTNGGTMNKPRYGHSATLLPNGMVLLAGGTDGMSPVAASALYLPNLGHEGIAGTLPTPRVGHTATLLPDGQVLLAGGLDQNSTTVRSTELFDFHLINNHWSSPGALEQGRVGHATAQLPDGTVIITGGLGAAMILDSIEAY
jgi:hypothetical protein